MSLCYVRSLKELLSDSLVGSSVHMPPTDVVLALTPGDVPPSSPVAVVPFINQLGVLVMLPCVPSPPNAFRAISKYMRAPCLSSTCNAIHASSMKSLKSAVG
jgi:hypothetical protein